MTRRGCLLLLGGLLASLAVVVVLVSLWVDSEGMAWVSDCGSENMSAVQFELGRYQAEHRGSLPASEAEIIDYVTRARGVDYFRCRAAGARYRWRPGLRDEEGREVLVMCPPGSHGVLRSYSLGLVATDRGPAHCVIRGARVRPR